MCSTDKKARNYIICLPHDKCPTEAKKIEYTKMSYLLTSEDKTKPNSTEFPFLYYLGWHLRKQQNKSEENKNLNDFFAVWRNSIMAQERWKLQIKKTKKTQANYLEINRISTVLN